MEKTSSGIYTDQDIQALLKDSTPQQVQQAAPKLSEKQLSSAITFLNTASLHQASEKLHALVAGSTENSHLESIGATLTHEQMLSLLSMFKTSNGMINEKLSPLLVGMPKEVFAFVLRQANPDQLQILQNAGSIEPMQHHLTMLSHNLNGNLSDFAHEFSLLEEITQKMDINDIGFEDIVKMTKRIEMLRVAYHLLNEMTERGLAIAWHTDRSDLIEKYNTIRSICHKNTLEIGSRGDGHATKPTGLFLQFGNRIMSVFGNPDDPHDVEALQNDEPAIEALAKFSVWYLEDFYEVGLLPEINTPDQLDLDPKTHSEQERAAYRNDLIQQARQNLEQLGIKTVADLKINAIFSKITLQEFINRIKPKR